MDIPDKNENDNFLSAGVGRVGSVKTKAVFSFNYKIIIEIIITPL